MGNVRGNYYSRNHTHLFPDEVCFGPWWRRTCKDDREKFWAFSFDEMGKYDLPAMVERIREVTGRKKVNYVGHSQGSVVLFSSVAQFGHNFSRKINKFFALAPAAALSRMETTYGKFLNETSYAYRAFSVSKFITLYYD